MPNNLNKPNKLYDTVARLQRVCGQPCRGPRRQVFVAGVEPCRKSRRGRSTAGDCTAVPRFRGEECRPQSSRASRATYTLPTVFPSLRAHKPNPAGRDPSGPSRRNTSKILLLQPKTIANCSSAAHYKSFSLRLRTARIRSVSSRSGACGHSSPRPAPGT